MADESASAPSSDAAPQQPPTDADGPIARLAKLTEERARTGDKPPPPQGERPSWRRRKILVDKQLQFTYLGVYLMTAGLLVAGFITLNVLFYFLFRRVQTQSSQLGAPPDLGSDFYNYAVINMVFVIVMVIGMAFYAIVHSHRIAGPAMRLRRCLGQLRSRDYAFHLKFRAKDYLHEIAEEVNGLTDEMRARDQGIAEAALLLEKIARDLSESESDADQATELRRIADSLAGWVLPHDEPEEGPQSA